MIPRSPRLNKLEEIREGLCSAVDVKRPKMKKKKNPMSDKYRKVVKLETPPST